MTLYTKIYPNPRSYGSIRYVLGHAGFISSTVVYKWVAVNVKELNLNYHNVHIYQKVWFLWIVVTSFNPSPARTYYLGTGAFKGPLRTYYLGTWGPSVSS